MAKSDYREWIPGILNAFVLGALLASIVAANYVIDPFALNRRFDLRMEKSEVTFKLSYYNWKLAEFQNEPTPIVLFGDSRTNTISEEEIEGILGKPTYNFAFGGSNGFDAIDAFWFAASETKLERVYIGLNATTLNDRNRVRRARQAFEIASDPPRYYSSPLVTQATFKVLLFNFADINLVTEKPPMSEDEFWRYQLATAPGQLFADYAYPANLLAELREVAQYCEEHEIVLTFLILPTHVDLQARREDFGIEEQYRDSIRELREMSTVYDWDYPNEITKERANFLDPFHMTEDAARRVSREISSGNPILARTRAR